MLALMLGTAALTKAQGLLGIDSALLSYSYTSNTSFNSLDLYKITVLNYDTASSFTGSYEVAYAVDSAGTGTFLQSLDSNLVSNVTIAPSGGLTDSAIISIDTRFRSGINTVVIWPRMSSTTFNTVDSLKLQVLVMGFAGITQNDLVIKHQLFPNPANQQLFVLNKDPNFIIERVSFWTTEGKLIHTEAFKGKLDVSSLPAGPYFIEFISTLGKTTRYKLIKE